MTAATDRVPRLLALVPYLVARPGISLPEAAADFGISSTQLRKDLELLWMCGLPGHGPGDLIDLSFEGDVLTVRYDAGISRPLRLTRDEALSLVVALRALAELPDLHERDVVTRALAKLETAVSDAVPTDAVAVRLDANEAVLRTIRRALRSNKVLHLTYFVPTRDEITDRNVDPMRLITVNGRLYLEAWCRRVQAVRLFRLDRVDAARVLDEPAQRPAQARSRDLAEGVYVPAADDLSITLRLTPAARWVTDYYVCDAVRELPGGDTEVKVRLSDEGWARRLVLGLGDTATVLQPEHLRLSVQHEARKALAAYALSPDSAPLAGEQIL